MSLGLHGAEIHRLAAAARAGHLLALRVPAGFVALCERHGVRTLRVAAHAAMDELPGGAVSRLDASDDVGRFVRQHLAEVVFLVRQEGQRENDLERQAAPEASGAAGSRHASGHPHGNGRQDRVLVRELGQDRPGLPLDLLLVPHGAYSIAPDWQESSRKARKRTA